MGTELEWKYAADEKTLRLVAERYGGQNWRVIEMESLYFDTPARDLGQRRWTLRLRRENGVGVVCLKTPGTGRARGEWEVRCEDPRAALPLLAAEGAPSELAALTGGQTLEPVCGARFTRRAALLPLPGDGTVELCLDAGELFSGERRAPLCEVEAELKSGEPEEAERFAQALAAQYGLREEPESKFRRASRLA
ncbi:MAG: CYTH domain-containing protein [Oscillospiraceae bacterium]|nr:CYTH domain-containing protein [Oscillospiraceae bacterium]